MREAFLLAAQTSLSQAPPPASPILRVKRTTQPQAQSPRLSQQVGQPSSTMKLNMYNLASRRGVNPHPHPSPTQISCGEATATAILGATLADWQRRREEEEARKRAEAAAREEEGDRSGKRKTPGQRAYEKMVQQKHIIGALLVEKKENAEHQQARDEYRAGEKAYDIAQAKAIQQQARDDYRAGERAYSVQQAEKAELQAGLSAYYEGREAGEEKRTVPLACTANNPYGLPVYNKDQTALDWLIGLYKDENLPGSDSIERTKYVLYATESSKYVHFKDGRIPDNDSGFNIIFQDSVRWPNSDMQVGHYLTAVDISMRVHSLPPIVQPVAKKVGLAVVIGHELVGDDVTIPGMPIVGHLYQAYLGVRAEILSGGKVSEWFFNQNDDELQKILNYGPVENWDYLHNGNSIQDLRLSYEGWVAGQKLAEGNFQSPQEFSNYLEETLK